MTNLRNLARGQECQVRLEGICNGDPETTVLAHLRLAGITGMSQKAPDILACFCCSACHDCADMRNRTLEADFVRLAFYEGIFRTQYKLIKMGILVVK